MTIKQQLVYLPVKVEDELPKYPINVGLVGNKIPIIVNHLGNGKFKSVAFSEKEIPKGVESYLKKLDAFVFSLEQLNEYTANVIRQALETAAQEAKVIKDMGETENGNQIFEVTECYYDENDYPIYVEEESILNVFEEVYQKLKV